MLIPFPFTMVVSYFFAPFEVLIVSSLEGYELQINSHGFVNSLRGKKEKRKKVHKPLFHQSKVLIGIKSLLLEIRGRC